MAANAEDVGLPTGADASLESEDELLEAEAESEEVEDQESEEDSPPSEDQNLDENKDSFQERIDRITRYRREAEREADSLRRENEETRRRLQELESQLQSQKTQSEQKTLADFDYDEGKYAQYLRNEALQEARQTAIQEAQRIAQEERQRIDAEARQREFSKKAAEFAKQQSDYFEVTSDPNLPITREMADVITDSDIGPQIAYYLARHPDEAYSIARSNPAAQGRMIGKLEATLSAEIKAKGKKVSDAPKPAKQKVKGVEAGFRTNPGDPTSDKMSDEEWLKRREAQLAKRDG